MKAKRCGVCERPETVVELKHYESHSACVDRADCLAHRDRRLKRSPAASGVESGGTVNRGQFPSDSAKAAHFERHEELRHGKGVQPPKPSPAERAKAGPVRRSVDEILWGAGRRAGEGSPAVRAILFGKAGRPASGHPWATEDDLTPEQRQASSRFLGALAAGGDVGAAIDQFLAASR